MLRVAATPRREQQEGYLEEDVEDWNDPPPALPRWQRRREEDEMEEWDDPPPAPRDDQRQEEGGAEGNRLAARGGGPGCWNCGSRVHRYSACPYPRQAFCYGCGAEGVTLRECVRCAEGGGRGLITWNTGTTGGGNRKTPPFSFFFSFSSFTLFLLFVFFSFFFFVFFLCCLFFFFVLLPARLVFDFAL